MPRSRRRLPARVAEFISFPRNVWLLLAQNLAVFVGIGVQALVLNLYLISLGYREDFLGLIAFANTIAIGAAALPASALANRFGARRCLIAATIGLAIATVAAVSSPLAVVIILAVVVVGVSQAFIFVPLAPYLMENSHPSDHPRAFAVSFSVLSIGAVIGSGLGGVLPGLVTAGAASVVEGYRVALLVGAAMSGLGTVAMLLATDRPAQASSPVSSVVPPPVRNSSARRPPPPLLLTDRRFLQRDLTMMALSGGLLAVSTGLVVPFYNVYLYDQTGASTEQVGVVYAAGAALMAPLSLIGPALGTRLGTVRAIAIARLLAVPVILLPLLVTSFGGGMAAYVLRAALVSLTQPIDNAFALSRVPDFMRARAAAIRTISWNGGWALASVGAGSTIVRWGYGPVFVAAALCLMACVVVHYVAFRDSAPDAITDPDESIALPESAEPNRLPTT
ncbi:MAG TPA: MFS transporter [Chloroflexota bacterium]|nr:MFS transporter [Chloroflexota bacterium]